MNKLIKMLPLFVVGLLGGLLVNSQVMAKPNGLPMGAECDQSESCMKAEDPGNSGSLDFDGTFEKFVIKAGNDYIEFTGTDNDGCYDVVVEGNTVSWEKIAEGPDCKDVSHVQVWTEDTQLLCPVPPQAGLWSEQMGTWQYIPPMFDENIFGDDQVWHVGDKNFIQCLCPEGETQGTITTWRSTEDLSEEMVNQMLSEGWELVEDGGDWNLFEGTSYLVQSGSFTCRAE